MILQNSTPNVSPSRGKNYRYREEQIINNIYLLMAAPPLPDASPGLLFLSRSSMALTHTHTHTHTHAKHG